jgi:type VI secretion system protein ImpH
MAEQSRSAPRDLEEFVQALEQEPSRFGFFQALRRLETLNRDKPRIGTSRHPAEEPSIRFGQEVHMYSAPSTLAAYERPVPGKQRLAWLSVYFFGLLGPNGPLPLHLTELALAGLRAHGDGALSRFFNLFHHRMLSLFYRAWAINEPTVSFDRAQAVDERTAKLDRSEQEPFGTYLGALFGLGTPQLRDRDAFPDAARLHYAGLFAAQTRSASGLQCILSGYFGLPVAIEEFVPGWMMIPKPLRWQLGAALEGSVLGRSTVPGARVWSCQHKFRIRFGPLTRADYERFLPDRASLKRLVALVRFYVGDEMGWDVELILQRQEVPYWQLGACAQPSWTTPCSTPADTGEPEFAPSAGKANDAWHLQPAVRLGWTTWCASLPPRADAADLRFTPPGLPE